jgi:hypothetical protein
MIVYTTLVKLQYEHSHAVLKSRRPHNAYTKNSQLKMMYKNIYNKIRSGVILNVVNITKKVVCSLLIFFVAG